MADAERFQDQANLVGRLRSMSLGPNILTAALETLQARHAAVSQQIEAVRAALGKPACLSVR